MDIKPNGEIYSWKWHEFDQYRNLHDSSTFGIADEKLVLIGNDGRINIVGILTSCGNCNQSFHSFAFDEHDCCYDECQMLIFTEVLENALWIDSVLKKMLDENQKDIQRMLSIMNNGGCANGIGVRGKSTSSMGLSSNYTCPVCNRMYVHASGLSRHLEMHSTVDDNESMANDVGMTEPLTVDAFKCLICGQLFNSTANCLTHMTANHTEYAIDENDCIQECESKAYERVSLNQVIQCEYCMAAFDDILPLKHHQTQHTIMGGYECSNCDISSRNLKFMLNHRSRECPYEKFQNWHKIDATVQYACSECEFMCLSLVKLYEHRYAAKHFQSLPNKSTGQVEYFCEKCGQIVADIETLLSHTDIVHGGKRNKSTIEANASVRPYLCEVCGKGYTQSSHLYQHLRFHKGIKPFACTIENCTRRFTIRPDLNDHIRKCHTGERPYKCSDCNKTFLTGSVYYQHRLIHRNERRYGCSTCQKRFHRSDALKNHERIHSGEKPYACIVCTKTFRQKGDRDKHVRSRHQNKATK